MVDFRRVGRGNVIGHQQVVLDDQISLSLSHPTNTAFGRNAERLPGSMALTTATAGRSASALRMRCDSGGLACPARKAGWALSISHWRQ